MSDAMKHLMKEHESILRVVGNAEKACLELEGGGGLDKEFFEKLIDFVRNYADKFHHAKEEDILFVELGKPGVEMHCDPVKQMLVEHDEGRAFIRALEEGVGDEDVKKVISNARGYFDLIRNHIAKEDEVLYVMADDVLSKDVLDKMYDEFVEVDSKKDVVKYLDFADLK
jgi:hemerythrin-like domain-containing protein